MPGSGGVVDTSIPATVDEEDAGHEGHEKPSPLGIETPAD
jgi:hypothetical protein